ncbi:lasso peptide biosynthesis B2 protein [Hazenella sp. IB182357]|uniref:Lasso peptide biosynthesis B2 protein n=1 Tax=Polycladospora coralii TaxID=2771432 RepID=A0A926RXT8_9BACL|nr:lasso peptide biosynthesis B2 protein [Polycladospora coralii]MBD1372841.1 lasso peptide biosynthesis B2 protein [Polycladospora coralii]
MIYAWFYLLYASYLLKTRSLEQIQTILIERKLKCMAEGIEQDIEEKLELVLKVNRFYFTRTACLENSLALFLWTTSKGEAINWCVGVRLAPFSSHAWIEVDGQPVGESIDHYKKIIVI